MGLEEALGGAQVTSWVGLWGSQGDLGGCLGEAWRSSGGALETFKVRHWRRSFKEAPGGALEEIWGSSGGVIH